ncbi:MAG: SDR family NAD(P)-dependent oxidoreductase, partial [Acidimicrobiales bacterium]|nr:SDR family NAD(P)-dependent oxidoreductase [Acidimicrobiales bacterium]
MTAVGWSETDIASQAGRIAVVTGASAGLGLETARQLAVAGATVVLAVRSPERGAAAIDDIRGTAPDADLRLQQLDLASLKSVATAAEDLHRDFERIDLLINNAGVMFTDRELTADGFELQFGTNHLGHFAFTAQVIDLLLPVAGSRVVTVASHGHWAPFRFDLEDLRAAGSYNRFVAYSRSKLANLLFHHELHRRLTLAGAQTIALAAHPGGSDTELVRHVPGAAYMRKYMNALAQSAAMGALPTLRAATDPLATGGQYYGPNRLLEMKGHPILVRSSRRSQDPALQARLWDRSVAATGVDLLA